MSQQRNEIIPLSYTKNVITGVGGIMHSSLSECINTKFTVSKLRHALFIKKTELKHTAAGTTAGIVLFFFFFFLNWF